MTTLGSGGDLNNGLYRRPVSVPMSGTANATKNNVIFVVPAGQKYMIASKGEVVGVTGPASAAGTILLDIIHRDSSGNVDTVLVNDFNLESLTAKEGAELSLPIGYVLDEHDSLYGSVISNNADATGLADLGLEVDLVRIA